MLNQWFLKVSLCKMSLQYTSIGYGLFSGQTRCVLCNKCHQAHRSWIVQQRAPAAEVLRVPYLGLKTLEAPKVSAAVQAGMPRIAGQRVVEAVRADGCCA